MRAAVMMIVGMWWSAPVCAQVTIPNPLHQDIAAKPERPTGLRSPAQRLFQEDTRACSADWQSQKAALRSNGQTWQTFARSCRAARKAARGV
jgi:hypothetical protein